MPRTRSVAWSELKLGIVGVVALLLASMMIIAVGGEGGFFWQRYPLKTVFNDVNGLRPGAVVRVSGKDVGKVKSVEFDGAAIVVGLQISKSVRPLITTASRASLGSISLLGEPVIDITAAPDGTPLQDWQYVGGAPVARKLGDLTETAGKGLEQANAMLSDLRAGRGTMGKLLTDEAVYNELQGFVGAANRVAVSLETTKGTAGSLINDPKAYNELNASLENLQAMTTRLNNGEGALGALLKDPATEASIKASTANVQGITDRINKGDGTASKLINEHELYDRLNAVSKHLDEVTQALNSGKGTAGALVNDRKLYDNMNSTVDELKALFSDIRKDPKKYLNVHVSIF